jgi:hypothetical protein
MSRRFALTLIAMQATVAAHADEPKGSFGFAARMDAIGGPVPTLNAVFIQSVQPDEVTLVAVAGRRSL